MGKWTEEKRVAYIPWNKGLTKETDERVAKKARNYIPWNKGKTGVYSVQVLEKLRDARLKNNPGGFKKGCKGIPFTEKRKQAMSLARMGENNPFYGSKHTKKFKRDMSERLQIYHPWRGRKHTEKAKKQIGDAHRGVKNFNYGKPRSDKIRRDISKSLMGRFIGKNNPNWQGGISFEPYGPEFNELLKEQIRSRDQHTCQKCGTLQKDVRRKLDVHHIDYNKKNNTPQNLISLCQTCNIIVNYDRERWTPFFGGIIIV